MMRRISLVLGLLITLVFGLVAWAPSGGSASSSATPAGTPSAGVVREVLDTGQPAAAPGQLLQLVRYTIPPHTALPVHTHPGMQVAQLEAGTLHYGVVKGSVQITRAATDGTPGPTGTLSAGQETDFHPGDGWVEPVGMVHFARNDGSAPVVILVASLLAANQPSAILVPAATPAP